MDWAARGDIDALAGVAPGRSHATYTVGVERLWTPWRMAFIQSAAEPGGAEQGCFLCAKAADDRGHDRDNLVLYRGERCFALLNLFPYNTGHLMLAPYAHTGDFGTLDANTAAELTALTQKAVAAIQATYRPDAFNIGMNLGRIAGAGVPDHLHVHVVPRWSGDTNFMPVIGETKVMPEALDQTYDRLAPRFQ